MSQKRLGLLFTIVVLVATSSGCGPRVYWGEWTFVDFEDQSVKYPLSIDVNPQEATVLVDGKPVGTGSCNLSLEYLRRVAIFERKQWREEDGSKRVVNTAREERRPTDIPHPYVIEIVDEDYQPTVVPVLIPPPDAKHDFRYELKPRRYVGAKNVKCGLTIIARPHYFDNIKAVIAAHAAASSVVSEDKEQEETLELGVKKKVYSLTVPDIGAFSMLVDDLQNLAQSNQFVFHITDATLNATFDTNVSSLESTVTISGAVRRGSKLYLIRKNNSPADAEPIRVERGTWKKTISLLHGQTDVYLLSVYQPEGELSKPLPVFLKQAIWDKEGTELTQSAFESATGVVFTEDDIAKLAAD